MTDQSENGNPTSEAEEEAPGVLRCPGCGYATLGTTCPKCGMVITEGEEEETSHEPLPRNLPDLIHEGLESVRTIEDDSAVLNERQHAVARLGTIVMALEISHLSEPEGQKAAEKFREVLDAYEAQESRDVWIGCGCLVVFAAVVIAFIYHVFG